MRSINGYSPCPTEIIQMLATLAEWSPNRGIILDNCAGDGTSAALLAEKWNLIPKLIEPSPERHQLAIAHDSEALLASASEIRGSGRAEVWYFNPPFDSEDITSEMEAEIFQASVPYCPSEGTLCIWLLHHRNLSQDTFLRFINQHLRCAAVRRFPEPYFSDFQQVVVLGYWSLSRLPNTSTTPLSVNLLKPFVSHELKYSITSNSDSGHDPLVLRKKKNESID